MELCNDHMIGPVFSHAADIYNHMGVFFVFFFLNDEIPRMESVLVCLFVICASQKHASKNTQLNQL